VRITGGGLEGWTPPATKATPPQFCVFKHARGVSFNPPPPVHQPIDESVKFRAKNASRLIFDHVYFQKNSGVYTTTTLEARVMVVAYSICRRLDLICRVVYSTLLLKPNTASWLL